MTARVGIELSGAMCRLIELESSTGSSGETAIRMFASMTLSDPVAAGWLASMRGRRASVVLWTPHSTHRRVVVAPGSYEQMRADALAVFAAGHDMTPFLCDIAPVDVEGPGPRRRTVLLATAPQSEVASALRPLHDARIRVERVLTPAAALGSLARLRGGQDRGGLLEAFVALEETAIAIALVRDGILLAARQAPWGYWAGPSAQVLRPKEEIATRVASELSMTLVSASLGTEMLGQVSVCGALPGLRSMAVALMEHLDVEVEPLDSLFGIDASCLPEPADTFRERTAEARLVWAAAMDPYPLLDLYRLRQREARRAGFTKGAIAAGVAVGLAGGWQFQRLIPADADRLATSVRAQQGFSGTGRPPDQSVKVLQTAEPAPAAPQDAGAAPAPQGAPLPMPPSDVLRSLLQADPLVWSAGPEPSSTISAQTAEAPPADGTPLAFDARLNRILYGPRRQLAIVDDQIVKVGDAVKGAHIVEITPTAVYLRDEDGRLRQLTAGASRR